MVLLSQNEAKKKQLDDAEKATAEMKQLAEAKRKRLFFLRSGYNL
jgi:hypothetical protein